MAVVVVVMAVGIHGEGRGRWRVGGQPGAAETTTSEYTCHLKGRGGEEGREGGEGGRRGGERRRRGEKERRGENLYNGRIERGEVN